MEVALPTMSPAERCYQNIKRNVANYQMRHKEQTAAKTKRYQDKIRLEQPERYEQKKAQQREYYHRVVKQKTMAKKAFLTMSSILETSEENL